MSTPAGWYDDGSGRQRWWDGQQWTENYAPGGEQAPAGGETAGQADAAAAPAAAAHTYSAPAAPAQAAAEPVARRTAVLGFIGLGLAVVGTVLACIPNVLTFAFACVVLLAAFVVSLIAVFQKGRAKWPSIAGMVLSVVGGIVGIVVLVITLATAISHIPVPTLPSDFPTSPTSEQPSDPPATGDSEGRPSPEAIGQGWKTMLNAGGYHQYDDDPEFFTCIGEHLYASDLSDEMLRDAALAESNVADADWDHAFEVGQKATYECDPSLPNPEDQ